MDVMTRFTLSALAGIAFLAAPAATIAADYPQPPPYLPPPAEFGKDWYLKGYIGLAAQHYHGLDHPVFHLEGNDFTWIHTGEFAGVPLFGVGVGFRHSANLRFDLTAEYRAKSDFSALDSYADTGEGAGTNYYTGKKQELLFLANAYYDLGDFHGLTPYVGAGIGASYNTIYNFYDVNEPQSAYGFAADNSKWSLAWALHAGASMPVNERLTLDFGYSFVKLGDAETGIFYAGGLEPPECVGGDENCAGMTFRNIYSHDFKVAARWSFGHSQPSWVSAKY